MSNALTLQQLERLATRHVSAASSRMDRVTLLATGLASAVLERYAAWMLARYASRVMDDTLWMRGVARHIEESPTADIEWARALQPSIERLQNDARNAHTTTAGLMQRVKRQATAATAAGLLEAVQQLFEACEAVRWALLEQEAQADVDAGRVSSVFTSHQDLLSALKAG